MSIQLLPAGVIITFQQTCIKEYWIISYLFVNWIQKK